MMPASCLKERRARTRGVVALKQLAGLHCFSNMDTVLATIERKVFTGTNSGDVLGPVSYVPWQDSWKQPCAEKRSLYGDNRRPVGGRAPGDDSDNKEEDEVGDDDDAEVDEPETPPTFGAAGMEEEPVFWWSMPSSYFEELIHSYHAKCIIDLSPGSGEFALAALQHKPPIQYLGQDHWHPC